jgi:hypothetical protein
LLVFVSGQPETIDVSSKLGNAAFVDRTVNATALVRLGAPTPDEMGFCEGVRREEIGRIVTVFTSGKEE